MEVVKKCDNDKTYGCVFRFGCPCCKSYTKYKNELSEVENDFRNGEVYNDELTVFSADKIKQRIEQFNGRGGD